MWLRPGKTNKEERVHFIGFWADYVRTHTDAEWSRQQNVLINAVMSDARRPLLTAKEYLKIKGELR